MIPSNSFLTNRLTGALMLAAAVLMIFAMLHHPEGAPNHPSDIEMAKWVHGSLIFLLVFSAYGVRRFTDEITALGQDTRLGFSFYQVGLGAFIGAALISGFVQTALVEVVNNEVGAGSDLNRFAAVLNQALAKLGVMAFGAAGLFFTPALITQKGLNRFVGVVGGVVGLILILSMFSGMHLSVMSMTVLMIAIVLWHSAIAFWMLKN